MRKSGPHTVKAMQETCFGPFSYIRFEDNKRRTIMDHMEMETVDVPSPSVQVIQHPSGNGYYWLQCKFQSFGVYAGDRS